MTQLTRISSCSETADDDDSQQGTLTSDLEQRRYLVKMQIRDEEDEGD